MPSGECARRRRDRSRSTVGGAVMGDAVAAASTAAHPGRVVGVFGRGFYVETDGHPFAVVAPGVWPGPLHLTLDGPFEPPDVGQEMTLTRRALVLPDLVIRLAGCRRWSPMLPASVRSMPGAGGRAPPAPPPDLRRQWPSVIDSVHRDDLDSARVALEGRGSGLTPEGDDVLAGILLARSVGRRRRPELELIAGRARTTRLSRAFLRWAAVGQSIQPAHDVLMAAADSDVRRLDSAVERLIAVGASSGRALLAGMLLAMAVEPGPTGRDRPQSEEICLR